MQDRSRTPGTRARTQGARAAALQQRPDAQRGLHRWLWVSLTAGLLAAAPAWAQTTVVPEREAPTIPPGAGGDQGLSRPRSENPSTPLDGARPVPDRGVVAPPAAGSTPVLRPPTTGSMPVIPPPGSAGGDKSVIPK